MEISDRIHKLSERAMADAAGRFREIDDIAQTNTEKVLDSFRHHRVSDSHFSGTTGYGYNDNGRETLDKIYASIFGMDSAIVRVGFASGTHAITCALFAALRPGQTLLSATGTPYDTLRGVIGVAGMHRGSLRDYGIGYSQIELGIDGRPNLSAIEKAVKSGSIGAVFIQRSRGYSSRRALSVYDIDDIRDTVHGVDESITVFVDNCYGEFTETIEPGDLGVDLIAGSLIKNPGGGLAPSGGYVAGREDLVEAAAFRLTAPGIGGEIGATLGINRLLFQGLFMAPHTVAQAMKTAVFSARLFELMGYKTSPGFLEPRSDIIQMIELGSPKLVECFCRGIQESAPIDSFAIPVGGDMPGYDCPVIMAAGAFVQGASIELSADGPMREPFNVFVQGGLTFEAGKLGIMRAAAYLENYVDKSG